ncbi:M23 family metallopeptidase [candidate division TA06 bacterium]|nr:M23 family metallopeptidase [candidate division TA06 bacterium]
MKITFLPKDFMINICRKVNTNIESDFLVRAIRIKNTTPDTIVTNKIVFDIKIKGKIVKQMVYTSGCLKSLTKKLVERVARISSSPAQISQLILGTEKLWDNDNMSNETILKPGQETGILQEHFRILNQSPVDECVVSVHYLQAGKEKKAVSRIPIVKYENKNRYIFPLKGAWLAINNYDNIYIHRQCYGQEFAMDFIQITKDFKFCSKKKTANKDYPGYGKNIHAVAGGKVVDCFNDIPENPRGFGSRLPKHEWDRLREKCGFVAALAGNYIVLKHKGNEYSCYAHLIPGSLTVKNGQAVKQGQIIGRLGNSGNSDAPHLHFQLMNGPSILTGRGLPCRFNNLKDICGEPVPFIEENNSMVHAG